MHAPRQPHAVSQQLSVFSYFSFFLTFFFLWRCRFFQVFRTIIPLRLQNTLYVFLPDGVLYLPCDHGLDFDLSVLCEISINQPIKKSRYPIFGVCGYGVRARERHRIYIYIYIYICVCVLIHPSRQRERLRVLERFYEERIFNSEA